tara:strand:- start:594 stop:2153 length:1560 start_codon:yes stop_codon:yes gene_type:complete
MEFLQNIRQNLFNTSANQPQQGQESTFLQRLQDPRFLGLLSAAAAIPKVGTAEGLAKGAQVFNMFSAADEERKRKDLLQKLISEGGFTPQEQALIAATPSQNQASVAAQIRAQKAAAANRPRQIETDITGRKRYTDTGEPVFQNVEQNELSPADEEILDLSVKLNIPMDQASKMYFEKQGYQLPGSEPKLTFNMPEQIYNDLPTASKNIVANLGIQGITYGTDEFTKRFAALTAPQEQDGFRFASPTEIAAFRSAGGLSDDAPLGGVLYINTKDNSPKFIKTGSTAPNITVNTDTSAFKDKYLSERGKILAAEQDISGELEAIATFNALEDLVTDEDFYSGTGGELVLQAKQALVSLGIADENMTASSEAFRAQTRKAALDGIGGSLGVGFSNADRDFIVEQNPSLSNTPAGNLALIKLNRNIQQRRIDTANEISRYLAENNYEESGLNKHLTKWAEEQPSISKGIFENELNINFGDVVYPPNGDFSGFTKPMLDAIDTEKLTQQQIEKLLEAYKILQE